MDGVETARRLIAEEREKKTGFLDLGNLQLTELPSEVLELTHLQSLNLGTQFRGEDGDLRPSVNGGAGDANAMSRLLNGLGTLAHLRELSVAGNPLVDLTPLQPLTALQSLTCSGTQVSDLTPLQPLTALQSLDCSYTQVSDLTPLQPLTALQSLNCSGTQVRDLTPLQPLTALQSLNCSGTQVSDLTPLQPLTALQSLDCSGTQVSDLTPLQPLTALQSLICWGTQVSDLTPLQPLTALQWLDCSSTQLSDLTPLQPLAALQSLDCSYTQVRDITPLIVLSSLSRLVANGCRLTDLPVRLVRSQALNELILFETAVPGVPSEVLSSGHFSNCLRDLRSHLADLEVGAEEIDEAKLVVLGNGRVGKTQICRRLRGLPYDEAIRSTHGITVTADPWAGSSNDGVLNIWDFGGQDIYHGAHTLFMKTRAVFLVVWHPDFESAGEHTAEGMLFRNYPLSYWLEYVRTLGSRDCPLIVVQARCDRPEQEIRRLPVDDAYLEFSSLKPCWYSAKTNRGKGALEDAIGDAIQFVRETEGVATIGAGRMRVLRQLEAWRNEDQRRPREERHHRTLSHAEFRALCEGGQDVSSPDSLLAYLHNLGVVFYQSNLFQDRIILDQSWALEAVYAVFDRRKAYSLILSQGGRFSPSLLAMTAWQEYSDTEQRLFLSLMESCGIVFQHRQADQRLGLEPEYIAPDMLPGKEALAAQLAGRWNDQDETRRLEYEYPFLHPGLMRALLCEIGRRSHDAGVYWKYGAWVYEKSTGCRASVEQRMTDDRRGHITIEFQGPRHDNLAAWLREQIEKCNRLFGYTELKPSIDDLGVLQRPPDRSRRAHRADNVDGPTQSSTERHALASEVAGDASEPRFDRPPASFFPPRKPEVFVSYAWGDETSEGRQRAKLVDDLFAAFRQRGLTVRRDRDEMRPGDLISEFMERLAEGDFIIAVISDKYLRSEYCMYELFRVYRNCADKPDRFVRKIIPLILPDARLTRPADRLRRAIYWKDQEEEQRTLVEQHVAAVGTEFFRKFKLIGEFARNTSNMLEYLTDKLQPRDFDRQAAEGFHEVLSQIERTAEAGSRMR